LLRFFLGRYSGYCYLAMVQMHGRTACMQFTAHTPMRFCVCIDRGDSVDTERQRSKQTAFFPSGDSMV
jgi:hypothetical protein